jgi:hypothetical protein
MKYYECDVNDSKIFNRQIDIFNNIIEKVDYTKLIKMKYSNINNIYMMVHKNYKNGKITEDQ